MDPAVSGRSSASRLANNSKRMPAPSLLEVWSRLEHMLEWGAIPNLEADDDRRALVKIRDDLAKLTRRKLRGRDALAIQKAVSALEKLIEIGDHVETLNFELAEIDKLHEVEEAEDQSQIGKVELMASALSLHRVCDYLVFSAPSHSLTLLKSALAELIAGGTNPAMFAPLDNYNGRPPDTPSILGVKGVLAGMMHAEQAAGMSRARAAKHIANNISPKLATRISRKPITSRAVEEWLDRFGGDYAEDTAGRRSYLIWSSHGPTSAVKIREVTDRIAKTLTVRKPR
jgi:hypothetical protein